MPSVVKTESFKKADNEGTNVMVWGKCSVCVQRRGPFNVDVTVTQGCVSKINNHDIIVADVGKVLFVGTEGKSVRRPRAKHEIVKVKVAVHKLDLLCVKM